MNHRKPCSTDRALTFGALMLAAATLVPGTAQSQTWPASISA